MKRREVIVFLTMVFATVSSASIYQVYNVYNTQNVQQSGSREIKERCPKVSNLLVNRSEKISWVKRQPYV